MPTAVEALLDRESELEHLDDALIAVGRERGGLVVIVGSAGIGKTTLLDAAAERAPRLGLAVARARAGELERTYPFGVARQLFAQPALSAHVRAGADERAGTPAHAVLERAAPGGAVERAADEFGVLEGLWSVLAETASDVPIVAIIDDLHWADAPSLRWLAFLARRLADIPVLVLAAARPPERDDQAEQLHAVLEQPEIMLLRPAGLGEQAVAELVAQQLGSAPEPGFVRACLEATGGNPFHVRELLGTARREGLAPAGDRADELSRLGPEAVGRDVLARCRNALDGALALAEAVAVLGEHATVRHAAALAGLDSGRACELIDALARVDVLRAEPPLGFAHPVLRTAVAGSLTWGRRSALHTRAAALLRAEDADPDLVAVHLCECEPAGDPANAGVLRAAASAAATRGAAGDAMRLLGRALAEPPPAADRLDYECDLALLVAAAGDSEAEGPLRRVVESDLPLERRHQATTGLLRLRFRSPDADGMLAICRWLAERLPVDDSDDSIRLRAALHSALLHRLPGDSAAQRDELLAGLERAATRGSAVAAFYLHKARLTTALRANRPVPEIAEHAQRSAEAALSADQIELGVAVSRSALLVAAGRVETARAGIDTLQELARSNGSSQMTVMAHAATAGAALVAGDLERAELHGRLAFERGPGDLVVELARALVEQGRLEQAERLLASVGRYREPAGTLHVLALLRLAQQRPAEALAQAEQQRSLQARLGYGAQLHLIHPWAPVMALALNALGRCDEARALLDDTVATARSMQDDRILGICLTAAGHVEPDSARAIELLREASERLERTVARLEHAKALHAYGGALRRADRRRDAREPLRRALDLASGCGATHLAEQIRTELGLSGARPRRDRLAGADALTPAERRVALLASDGLSNPDIARTLYITRKTVEKLLTQAYRKLDVGSRAELADALRAGDAAKVAA